MFGREARLPVDFILGRVRDLVSGTVHDWVQEHQSRLQLAFESVRGRLKAAAEHWKRNHDQRVRSEPLEEGQLVFLRAFGGKGRCKIQDKWNPVLHRVVQVPPQDGPVYAVAPVDDLSKVKRVHCTLLKGAVGVALPHPNSVRLPSPPGPPVMHEESSDEDLLALVGVPPSGAGNMASIDPATPAPEPALIPSAAATVNPPSGLLTPSAGPPLESKTSASREAARSAVAPSTNMAGALPSVQSAPLVVNPSRDDKTVMRRTARTTAGQHSNFHCLPRSANRMATSGPSSAISNTVAAFFRPWQ